MVYIEKEANNIDEQALDVKKAQEFINEKSVYDFILNQTPEKVREIGIKHRTALAYLKKKRKAYFVEIKFKLTSLFNSTPGNINFQNIRNCLMMFE